MLTSFRLGGLLLKNKPRSPIYEASGRVFMLFGVLPDSNKSNKKSYTSEKADHEDTKKARHPISETSGFK